MNWLTEHRKSEQYAANAESAMRLGNVDEATRYYTLAADAEATALKLIDYDKVKTFGITAVSAASLYFKGNDLDKSEEISIWSLSQPITPVFAKEQLKSIIQTIWNERIFRESGIEFVRGELLVSVAGGLVATGAAPLELVHRKVDEVKNLYFRAVEMLLGYPVRRKGFPPPEVRENFRPWIVQAPAGSYQFTLRVEKPQQANFFEKFSPEVEKVTSTLLQVIGASSVASLNLLETLVPNEDYRDCFLKQTRNLAPTGKSFERLTIKATGMADTTSVVFSPQSRKALSETIKTRSKTKEPDYQVTKVQISGILVGLQLNQDWLEITVEDTGETLRIYETGDAIDDLIGPMVNHKVIVDVAVKKDGKKTFLDIQSQE
jgi:hypothetical protein